MATRFVKIKVNPAVISKIERFWDSNIFNEMVGPLWIYFIFTSNLIRTILSKRVHFKLD